MPRPRAFVAFSFLVLSVVLAPALVNAAQTAKKATPAKAMTLREFVKVFLADAPEENQFSKSIGAFAGFPEGASIKVDGIPAEENVDGKDRQCSLVVETSEEGKPTPVCLIVAAKEKTDAASLSHYFRISLDGKLEKAFTVTGKLRDGKPVRGSGSHSALDVSSKEVLALMKKELEFWMKKYSKPKKQTAAVGGSGSKIVAAQ